METQPITVTYRGDYPLPIVTPFPCQCGERLIGSTGDGVNWQTWCPRCVTVSVSVVAIAEEV